MRRIENSPDSAESELLTLVLDLLLDHWLGEGEFEAVAESPDSAESKESSPLRGESPEEPHEF